MNNIFKILLNRPPEVKEIIFLQKRNANEIKQYIKNLDEFQDFSKKNLKIIEDIIKLLLDSDSEFNTLKYLSVFVKLNYDINKMKEHMQFKISIIREEYKDFYYKYLGEVDEISDDEIIQILNDDYTVQFYVTTSPKFKLLCSKKINELL